MTNAASLPSKQFTTIKGHRLAHVEMGQGDPIVLLHDNPTSSYLWRDVMPPLAGLGADQRVTLMLHDWGSALGFHWARPAFHSGRLRPGHRRGGGGLAFTIELKEITHV